MWPYIENAELEVAIESAHAVSVCLVHGRTLQPHLNREVGQLAAALLAEIVEAEGGPLQGLSYQVRSRYLKNLEWVMAGKVERSILHPPGRGTEPLDQIRDIPVDLV